MSSILIWRPEPLNARLVAAARDAAQDFARAAAVRAPARVKPTIRVLGAGTNFSVGSFDPVAGFFEHGTKPHTIAPKKKVLRLADGSFVTGPVRHPGMKAEPFLKPTLPLWAPLYRRQAAGAFRGF